jgi:pimeloyl-ACP methyl ester carboxylesterase
MRKAAAIQFQAPLGESAVVDRPATAQLVQSCVVALHCSLGSGRQWAPLAEALGGGYRVITPDISGYGDNGRPVRTVSTLSDEIDLLSEALASVGGPIHLVGHSYGGAIAFKVATSSPFVSRVRSLTLIEPVLPTILREHGSDRVLYDYFAGVGRGICTDLLNGAPSNALDKFLTYWNGAEAAARLSPRARLWMLERADKLIGDFMAVFAEDNLSAAAATINVPTLLFCGGKSPYPAQRIVGRLASLIGNAQARHLPDAGHMLAISHAPVLIPQIVRHLADVDGRAAGATSLEAV